MSLISFVAVFIFLAITKDASCAVSTTTVAPTTSTECNVCCLRNIRESADCHQLPALISEDSVPPEIKSKMPHHLAKLIAPKLASAKMVKKAGLGGDKDEKKEDAKDDKKGKVDAKDSKKVDAKDNKKGAAKDAKKAPAKEVKKGAAKDTKKADGAKGPNKVAAKSDPKKAPTKDKKSGKGKRSVPVPGMLSEPCFFDAIFKHNDIYLDDDFDDEAAIDMFEKAVASKDVIETLTLIINQTSEISAIDMLIEKKSADGCDMRGFTFMNTLMKTFIEVDPKTKRDGACMEKIVNVEQCMPEALKDPAPKVFDLGDDLTEEEIKALLAAEEEEAKKEEAAKKEGAGAKKAGASNKKPQDKIQVGKKDKGKGKEAEQKGGKTAAKNAAAPKGAKKQDPKADKKKADNAKNKKNAADNAKNKNAPNKNAKSKNAKDAGKKDQKKG